MMVQTGLEPYRHDWSLTWTISIHSKDRDIALNICLLLSKGLISTMINRNKEMGSVGKIEDPRPGSSPDPKLLDDVIGLLLG